MTAKLRAFLRDFWTLAAPYWSSEERWRARGLLLSWSRLSLGQVYLLVQLNTWNREFFDALQQFDQDAFRRLVPALRRARDDLHRGRGLQRLPPADVADPLAPLADRALRRRLARRARVLPDARWPTPAPTTRTSASPTTCGSSSIRASTLSLGLLRQIVTLASFVAILWGLSGSFAFTVGGVVVRAARLHGLGGARLRDRSAPGSRTGSGSRCRGSTSTQQRFEADFRFSLVRVRESAEGIALYGGEGDEARRLSDRFGDVWRNWWEIMRRQKRLRTFTVGFDQAAVLFPYLAAAPRYFAKEITFGALTQTANAFGRVQDALSFFVAAYIDLADWKATVDRLITFRARARARCTRRRTAAAGSRSRRAIRTASCCRG